MKQALKSLKEDDTIMVLPADKGRASVVLDTETYRQKMKTLIDSVPYRLLNRDLTNRLSRKTFGQRTHSHRVGGLDINYCNEQRYFV